MSLIDMLSFIIMKICKHMAFLVYSFRRIICDNSIKVECYSEFMILNIILNIPLKNLTCRIPSHNGLIHILRICGKK
ncbi:hypothetical protein AT480_22900 [Klebsiella pneumoniae]|nr:hypothetical protein AT470_23645 [Klebsiella pneumoniae]KSV40559.1 hypothetical protein AT480_22900 [Klebsiella pneumoniae]